ncbi:ABC transporter permease [Metallibacterium scheffleri]
MSRSIRHWRTGPRTASRRWLWFRADQVKGRIAAYLMLSVALAATVFCHTLLQGMAGTHIAGASTQRRYFTLGLDMSRGVDYMLDAQLVDQLMQRLPRSFAIATEAQIPSGYASLALPDGSRHIDVAINYVSAHYFQAVDLPNVLGRVITPAEAHAHDPEVVINRRCAEALFGSARAALGQVVVLHAPGAGAGPLHVVGVAANDFTGVRAADSHLPRKAPMAWVAERPGNQFYPALLSVPARLPNAVIRHDLDLAWQRVPQAVKNIGSRGLVFSQPFSMEPTAVAASAHQLRLYFDLAVAALLLTMVNLVAVNFLEALRRRSVHAIERSLGARRSWQMQRALVRSALGVLVTLMVSGALLVSALMVTQRAIATIHGRVSPWWRVGQVLHWSDLVIPVLVLLLSTFLIEVLVRVLMLTRELRESGTERASGPRGERQVGGVILALEFAFAMLLAVLAGWGVSYAWGMAHENLGMLQGPRLTVLSMGSNNAYVSAHPNAFAHMVSNAVLVEDLQRAIAGIEPHAEVGFGPVVGFPYRHGAGDFRRGDGRLETDKAAIFMQGFAVSANWLQVSGARLLAGRDFNPDNMDPRQILIDADMARTLFGSVQAAVGRQVHWKVFWQHAPIPFQVRGVIAPLYLNGPGRASVPILIKPLTSGGNEFMNGNHGTFLIRPAIPATHDSALQSAVQRVFAKDAPFLEVTSIQSSAQLLGRLDRPQRTLAMVFGAVAGFGLLIALTGLAVFLRLFLALRKRVDAIRQALGASPRRLYTGVLAGTVLLCVAGAVLALLFTPWLAQQFALLSGAQVAPFGSATWIALAVLLLAVFLVAHFPARRAARAEPAESLHEL